MEVILYISSVTLSAGWLISGVLFAFQLVKIVRTNNCEGINIPTFFGFSLLNANATLYAYLTANVLWMPGTILASLSCALIAWWAYRNGGKG